MELECLGLEHRAFVMNVEYFCQPRWQPLLLGRSLFPDTQSQGFLRGLARVKYIMVQVVTL